MGGLAPGRRVLRLELSCVNFDAAAGGPTLLRKCLTAAEVTLARQQKRPAGNTFQGFQILSSSIG